MGRNSGNVRGGGSSVSVRSVSSQLIKSAETDFKSMKSAIGGAVGVLVGNSISKQADLIIDHIKTSAKVKGAFDLETFTESMEKVFRKADFSLSEKVEALEYNMNKATGRVKHTHGEAIQKIKTAQYEIRDLREKYLYSKDVIGLMEYFMKRKKY